MENRNSLAWYGFQIKYCRGHSIRCRTKKLKQFSLQKTSSIFVLPLYPYFHPSTCRLSGILAMKDGTDWSPSVTRFNTTFDHHFQHLHIFHIHWFIHLSFSRLRVEWASFEGFTEWVVKGLEWFQDFLGLQVVKWGQECERAEWQQVLFCISLTSILSRRHPLWEKKTWKLSTWSPWKIHEKGTNLGILCEPFGMVQWPFQRFLVTSN